MFLGVLATNEIILIIIPLIVLVLVVRFIYRYSKQKERIEEMEKRLGDK